MRLVPFVVSVTLVGAGLLTAPTVASAADGPVALSSTASGPTSGAKDDTAAGVVITAEATDPVETAVLTATVPGHVDADDVTFTADGQTVPFAPGAVTAETKTDPERTELTANIGFGATQLAGGELVEGTYSVSVASTLSPASETGKPLQVASTLAYDDAGDSASQSTTATIPLPDIAVTAPDDFDFGKQAVSPGGRAVFFAQVDHRGATVADSILTITLPRGLSVDLRQGAVRIDADSLASDSDDDADFAQPLTCRRSSNTEVTCALGKLDSTIYAGVLVTAADDAPTTGAGKVTLAVDAANGLDATTADNAIGFDVAFVPPTRLRTVVTTDQTKVEIGDKAHVRVSVTNKGTAPVRVITPVDVENVEDYSDDGDSPDADESFTITDFSGKEFDLESGGSKGVVVTGAIGATNRADTFASRLGRTFARRLADSGSASGSGSASSDDPDSKANLRLWDVGTVAPGQTVTAVATVKADRLGRSDAIAAAIGVPGGVSECLTEADAGDDEEAYLRCPEIGTVRLQAVAASAAPSGNGDDPLAATGVPTGQLTGLGAALLLVGGLALYVGSRRSRVTGRHRPLL